METAEARDLKAALLRAERGPLSPHVIPGVRGVRWHRFVEAEPELIAAKLSELVDRFSSHDHDCRVIWSLLDAEEAQREAVRRANKIEAAHASSAFALGMAEAVILLPIAFFGLFEEVVFNIFDLGVAAGVRLVFVGTAAQADSLPYRILTSIERTESVCGCEAGF